MYIVFDNDSNFSDLRSKYLLLELDTIENSLGDVTSYCVIDKEHITINEIFSLEEKKRLHEALMRNYYKRNWQVCEQTIKHLKGSFKGELDSFYDILESRIKQLQKIDLPNSWTGKISAFDRNTITSKF